MAISKQQKEKMLQNLENLLKKAKSWVLIDYYGLKVKEINQLRRSLKEMGCKYLVAKKTLLKRVLNKLNLNINIDQIIGGIGLILGLEDEVAPAKLSIQFAREHEKMKIHGGIFDQELINEAQIKELAKLPNKEQLRTRAIWIMKSPLSGLVNVLQGNLRNLIYILLRIKN